MLNEGGCYYTCTVYSIFSTTMEIRRMIQSGFGYKSNPLPVGETCLSQNKVRSAYYVGLFRMTTTRLLVKPKDLLQSRRATSRVHTV